VAVLNTWQAEEDGSRRLCAALQCDGHIPPKFIFGSEATVTRLGWRFDAFELGPHRCPTCPPSGTRKPRAALRSANPALPNLLIVGAAKCGTTSLHNYLSAHPEIQMPEVKELRFFQDPRCLERLDDYAGFFDARAPVRGEATPAYTCYPLIPGVPERIRDAIPEAKLIYLIREPVERAIAGYAEAQANDRDERSADDALGDLDDAYNTYLAQSRYAMQVERYLRVFPREQLLVVHQADLLARRAETLRRIFRFLGVDEGFTSAQFEELANTRSQKRRRNWAGRALHNSRLLPVVRRIPSRPREMLLGSIRGLTSGRVEVAVDPRVRARLEAALGGEIERLTALLGPVSTPAS
jgi:hypothetical protein